MKLLASRLPHASGTRMGHSKVLGKIPCHSPSSLNFSTRSFEAFLTSPIRGSEARHPWP